MRPLLLSLFVALAGLSTVGCDSNPESVEPGPGLLPIDAQYAWSLESRIVETDSLLFADAQSIRIRTVDTDSSVPGYDGLFQLEARGSVGATFTWYEWTEEALREIAYASPGETPVVSPRGRYAASDVFGLPAIVSERAGALALRSLASDSITVREELRVVYELPFEIGASWVSFTYPFGSTREVVGRERVTVEAGTFDCFVIRTEIDILPPTAEFEWLDYVSPEHGLILRTTESVQDYRGPDNDNEPNGQRLRVAERLERVGGR